MVRGPASQAEFATKLGVHKNTIGRYERGKNPPDALFLVALRRTCGISLQWLLMGEGPMRDEPGTSESPTATTPEANDAAAPEPSNVDIDVLTKAIAFAHRALKITGREAKTPDEWAELIAACYDIYAHGDSIKEAEEDIHDMRVSDQEMRLLALLRAAG